MKRARTPVLITDAERSPEQQLRSREIRYVAMMSLRALCLVVAAVLWSYHVPWLWLWLPLCLVGMVTLPWFAVLLANDAPPKAKRSPAVPATTVADPKAIETRPVPPDKIIDMEP